MGMFKKSCWTNPTSPKASAPNPRQFTIEKTQQVGKNLVALVKYPNCSNFEGTKILVFKNLPSHQLRNRDELDPHFAQTSFSPFARFIPTDDGWTAATTLAKII